MADVEITYQVISGTADIERLARKISIEQSVETPESLITEDIERQFLGQLKDVELIDKATKTYTITLAYPEQIVSQQYNQLLNLCFGNVSMYPRVRLVDIDLPDHLLNQFQGPRFGIDGVRASLGVYGRPLLATALKPRGYSVEQFANMAFEFAMGGGDIIKDDQNLVGDFDEFKQRVSRCLAAIKEAEQKTGRTCLYFPFISAPYEEIEKYFAWVKAQGVKGVLLAPLILGLDTARGLAARYDLIYMAHPAFTGSYCISPEHGIEHGLLYGFLYRLAGVDISVYTNTGGRFEFTETHCKSIAYQLRRPLSGLNASLPCPAGGMQYEDLPRMCEWYEKDSVFLLGGSLLEYSPSLEKSTKAFKNQLCMAFEERLESPLSPSVSSCEYPANGVSAPIEFLRFENFHWSGRNKVAYKVTDALTFKNISRTELVGKSEEECLFDLRYFEIERDGFSSKELHQHAHVIIVARGRGRVLIGNTQYEVKENDVLYIKPMVIHQLDNPYSEPFGVYCIVDRERDIPVLI